MGRPKRLGRIDFDRKPQRNTRSRKIPQALRSRKYTAETALEELEYQKIVSRLAALSEGNAYGLDEAMVTALQECLRSPMVDTESGHWEPHLPKWREKLKAVGLVERLGRPMREKIARELKPIDIIQKDSVEETLKRGRKLLAEAESEESA